MNVKSYRQFARSYAVFITAGILVGCAIALGISLLQRPIYQSTVKVFVSTSQASSAQDLSQGGTYSQQVVKSYADIVTTPIVLQPVLDELGLDESVAQFANDVSADAPVDTVVINIAVRADSAETAANAANLIARQLTTVVEQLSPATTQSSAVRLTTVQAASPSPGPVAPRIPVNVVLGGLLGLLLSLSIAFLRQALDTKLRTSADVQVAADLPALGAVYFDPDSKQQPLVAEVAPQSLQAEAFRGIRTNLRFVATSQGRQALVATSTLPGEGKTTSLINLAISIAAAGSTVCVIDADLRRPRVASYLGLDNSIGLTDCLIGGAVPEEALQSWGEHGLSILPAGTIPPNPSELLQSSRAEELFHELRARFEVVLVDAPPLLPVTDAALVSKFVDGALIFAAVGRVRRGDLRRALDILTQIGSHVIGIVPTMVPLRGGGNYGYSGYYGRAYGESVTAAS